MLIASTYILKQTTRTKRCQLQNNKGSNEKFGKLMATNNNKKNKKTERWHYSDATVDTMTDNDMVVDNNTMANNNNRQHSI